MRHQVGAANAPVVPKGNLVHLKPAQLRPSTNNPRKLFDPEPLKALKNSIQAHGVLVPLTVYKLPGQSLFAIVDGERRYKCCLELESEGHDVQIPANVVEPPDAMASLIYMFNIHAFREQWELMPTALGLERVFEHLKNPSDEEVHQLTGLSLPQITRCKVILSFPKRYQKMSLEPDPKLRIPSNFWIELTPILDLCKEHLPELYQKNGRTDIIDRLVSKYRRGKIKSVVHFRRIVEAFETANDEVRRVSAQLERYILDEDLETRAAFDQFIADNRRIQKARDACERFINELEKSKVSMAVEVDRNEVIQQLQEVVAYVEQLLDRLRSTDPPEEKAEEEDDS